MVIMFRNPSPPQVSQPPMARRGRNRRLRDGAILFEAMVGVALLLFALLPLAYSLGSEKRLARSLYQRAVAMEIVDGEMETLAAGEWKSYTNGAQPYSVHAIAATNLPPGRFVLTIHDQHARLEWLPAVKMHGGPVAREASLK